MPQPCAASGGLYDDTSQCPILHVFKRIGGKWKLPILWHLAEKDAVRYNELKRSVRGVTNMMLTKCLRELEEYGLVHRRQYNEVPPRVEYSLTKRGKELLPALSALYAWGRDQMAFERDARATTAPPAQRATRPSPEGVTPRTLSNA